MVHVRTQSPALFLMFTVCGERQNLGPACAFQVHCLLMRAAPQVKSAERRRREQEQ